MEFKVKLSQKDIETLQSGDFDSEDELLVKVKRGILQDYEEGNYLFEEV